MPAIPATGSDTDTGRTERARATAPAGGPPPARCELCDAEARVRVLERFERGEPRFRRLCLTCVDPAYEVAVAMRPPLVEPRAAAAAGFAAAGALVGVLALAAEQLGWIPDAGLAWY